MLNGGTVETKNYIAIQNKGTGKVKVAGANIYAMLEKEKSSGLPCISNNNTGSIEVTAGTIRGNNQGIHMVKGTLTVTGGNISGETNGHAGVGIWIDNSAVLILGTNDSVVNTANPVVRGSCYGVYNSGSIYFYDGKIVGDDGSGSSIYMSSGSIVTPTGYTVKKSLSGTTETAILSKTSTTSVASEKAPMNLTIVSPNAVNTQSDSDSLNNITKEEISSTNIVASTPQSSQPKIQSNAIDSNNMISKNNLNTDEKNLTQTEQQINENKNSNIVQIAKRSYSTIAEAIASADSGEQIDLLEDITLNEEVIIEKDKNIIINLNDKTLNSTSANTINNKGTLKITGTGNIRNEVENGVVINNNGSLKIENGVITTSKNNGKCINNNSKLEMFGGKIISEGINSSVIYNNTKSETIIKAGTIEVNGDGSKGIYNNSSLVIYNTTDTKTTDNCKDSVKVIVSSDDSCGIYNSKDSTVCDIKCTDILIKADVIENYESIKNTDEFKAKLEEMKPSYGIYNNSNISVNIEGLTMKVERLKGVGIQNNAEGIINIGKKDEILNESNPIIYATSDNTTAIVNINKQKGKIKFYNGSFITTKSIKNEITDVLENYQVYEINDNVIIKSVLSRKEE
ncbi:MAG TPA: hypothetical protein DCZ30_00910 [Clostridiales bacterium]|nr:hypothetical protein [Clostridiales bacterium]